MLILSFCLEYLGLILNTSQAKVLLLKERNIDATALDLPQMRPHKQSSLNQCMQGLGVMVAPLEATPYATFHQDIAA